MRVGKRTRTPENRKSTNEKVGWVCVSVDPTAGGASAEVEGIFDDEPMCMLTTVPVSAQARKNGSQYPLWMLGSPRWGGISLKHTARTPRAALRRTSAAALWASHNGMRQSGSS